VFQGLRLDKTPEECKVEIASSTEKEVTKAEAGKTG